MSPQPDYIRRRRFAGLLPEVIFLPIVARELRVAARRPRTYYGRMMAAALCVAATAYVFTLTSTLGTIEFVGDTLFYTTSYMLFGWSLLSAWAGCDSISIEKREGTLGLLFLTDLKSYDIVLGKLAASALPSFYAALAALPVMAISMAMGGVSAAQYVKTGLAILNAFFLGQAVGVFSSSLCRRRGSAMGLTFLILWLYLQFAYSAVVPALSVATIPRHTWLAAFLSLNNPTRPFLIALYGEGFSLFGARFFPGPGYWPSLLVAHLHVWIFLALAIWVLPRRWREKNKAASVWRTRWEQWRFGSMAARAAFRRQLATVNPFLWLVCRGRFSPDFVWSIMGIFAMIAVLIATYATMQVGWVNSYDGSFVSIIVLLHLMLKMGVPTHAALLEEHRRSGSLETLLCCSPMSGDDIIKGMWLAIRRYYFWPAAVVIMAESIMFIAAFATGLRYSVDWDLLCFILVSLLVLIPDLRALGWMAMWRSMSNPRPRNAGLNAFFWFCIFPWMLVWVCYATRLFTSEHWLWVIWPTYALVSDAIVCRLARNRLRKNFRLWAAPSHGQALGFWGRLGRLAGLLWRKRANLHPA
jgi:ABC-type transport system involved in multi-copper enzyme maturation permease subunit